MNKYELALVVSAKVDDEVRNATVEKAKEYITTFGGTITNVDEWGKKRLAYEIQKMSEAGYAGRDRTAASHYGQRDSILMRKTGSIRKGGILP